jgi:hypothetical protein
MLTYSLGQYTKTAPENPSREMEKASHGGKLLWVKKLGHKEEDGKSKKEKCFDDERGNGNAAETNPKEEKE